MTSDNPLIRLTYVSEHNLAADRDGFHPAFGAIEATSVRRNTQEDITGFLICARTWFAQIMEGPQEAVDRLYARLETDPRHHALRLVSREAVDRRLFPDWAMALGHFSDTTRMVFASLDFAPETLPEPRQDGDLIELAADLAAIKRVAR